MGAAGWILFGLATILFGCILFMTVMVGISIYSERRQPIPINYYNHPPAPRYDPRLGTSAEEATARVAEMNRVATESGLRFASLESFPNAGVHRAPTRAVGYCLLDDCPSRGQGVFLLNSVGHYRCEICQVAGFLEKEVGQLRNQFAVVREVRLEFDFNPYSKSYRQMAIVLDNSLPIEGTNVYELKSPLIKTEKRALKVAEGLLAALQQEQPDNGAYIPRVTETLLDLDQPREAFIIQCQGLGKILEATARHRERINARNTD